MDIKTEIKKYQKQQIEEIASYINTYCNNSIAAVNLFIKPVEYIQVIDIENKDHLNNFVLKYRILPQRVKIPPYINNGTYCVEYEDNSSFQLDSSGRIEIIDYRYLNYLDFKNSDYKGIIIKDFQEKLIDFLNLSFTFYNNMNINTNAYIYLSLINIEKRIIYNPYTLHSTKSSNQNNFDSNIDIINKQNFINWIGKILDDIKFLFK